VPIFERYLRVLADRVYSLGGNPQLDADAEPDAGDPRGSSVTGKIEAICYDCFGDFIGFTITTCDGVSRYRATHQHVLHQIQEATRHSLKVTVVSTLSDPHRAQRICLHYT
jgi:hypothetical protein